MTAKTLEERRRNINKIRESFKDPGKSERYGDIAYGSSGEELPMASGFFRLRLLLAAALFAAFVYCDQNQVKIFSYTTQEVGQFIHQSSSVEEIIETIKEIP